MEKYYRVRSYGCMGMVGSGKYAKILTLYYRYDIIELFKS